MMMRQRLSHRAPLRNAALSALPFQRIESPEKPVTILSLAQRPELADELASWHYDQWAELYPGWTLNICRDELTAQNDADRIPTTLVAIDSAGQPGGTVSLLSHDLPGRDDLSPWLGNLFVRTDLRGRGLGSLLLAAAVAEARRLGIAKLYLFTPGHEAFYTARGWIVIGHASTGGVPVTIMARRTAAQETGT